MEVAQSPSIACRKRYLALALACGLRKTVFRWALREARNSGEPDLAPEAYRALFVCAALTAARLGELLGLQWKNVDLEGRKLRIEQSLWQRQLLPPKTAGSIRTVPFGEALGQVLREHFAKAIFRGEADFVFCKQMGQPLNPDVLRKDVLYPVLDRLKIPRAKGSAGFHTFRHSAASFINSQTGNLKLAQKLLGHSNLDTTANVYTHVSVEQEREAALAVERAIYGENPGDFVPRVVPNVEQNR